MKIIRSTLCVLFCFALPAVYSDTMLIDGTTPGYVLNGSFETTTGSLTVKDPGDWTHIGETADDTDGVQSNNSADGSKSAMIGYTDGVGEEDYTLAIDTNATDSYTISLGDSYELSFDHIGLFNWVTNDDMRYSLFYTGDDTLSGVDYNGNTGVISGATILESNAFDVTAGSYNTYSNTPTVVTDAGAVGKHLWLAFTSSAGSPKYGRIDQVNLTVIPEPSSVLLLGLAAFSLIVLGKSKRK